MFAGIDIASERHWLARLDDAGKPIGKPLPITEDRDGHDKLLAALGPAPGLGQEPHRVGVRGEQFRDHVRVDVGAGRRSSAVGEELGALVGGDEVVRWRAASRGRG